MGFIFNKPKVQQPQAQQTQPVNSLRINESVEGKTIPVAWGVNRLPQFLLWTGDFNKVAHTTPSQQVGGKSGNSGTIPGQTTYTYSTAFIAGLCAGPVDHIASVWNNAGKMAANVVTDTWTVPIGGGTHRPTRPNPIRNINVGIDQTFDTGTFTDFGSGVSNRLTGSFVSTVAVAPTASSGVIGFTVDGTGPIYTAGSEFGGQTLQLSYTVNTAVAWVTEEVAITSTSFTVSNPSTFIGWSSIVGLDGSQWFGPYQAGHALTTHQYIADNFGNFTFAAADIGQTVILTYQVSNSTNNGASTTLNLAFSTGEEGQPVWSWLASAHPSQAVNYSGLATVQSSFLDLGTDTSLPQLNYEIVGQHIQAGTMDCNPQDVIYGYLTDHNFGLGFPTENIEFGFTTPQSDGVYLIVPAINAPGQNAATFWGANGFFISTVVDNQSTLADEVKTILDAGQTAMIFSEGLLKLRPYGDTTAAANGYVYQPLTQPVVDLDFDDFVADPGSDPIQVSRTNWTGAFNKVQVQFENRAGGYNPSVITAEDTASINAIGLHQEDVQDFSFVKTYTTATWVSQMRVQRLANIRNTYSFTLPPIYEFIEPMDLVTITSSPMGFNQKPVRITSVEDDPEKGLIIQAEDFPYGLAQASIYPKQNNVGLHDSASTHPPGNTNVFMMETPQQLIGFQGFNVRLYASPDNIGDWGGCLVLTSFDNINYTQLGEIRTPALFGTLASSMTVGTGDPDTQSITITVPGGLQLLPSSTYDFANLQEPALFAIVDAAGTFEIVAYSNATLTATNTYSVSTFHRGLFGTGRSAHSSGATIIKLDQGYTELTYDQTQVGDTLYVLMPSFNTVGEMLQNPDTLTPTSLTLTGTYPGMFDLSAGTIALSRVSGAGTLAAKNNVDLATTDVLNKTAGNITYTGGATVDSLKPAESGAEQTTGKSIDILTDGTQYTRLPNAPTNRNLIPDSGFKTWNSNALYWSPSAWVLLPGQGNDGGNAIGYLGTGSASGFPEAGLRKNPILLAPGNYTLSAFIDATFVTTQHVDIGLYLSSNGPSAPPNAMDGGPFHLTQNPGQKGRVFINVTLAIKTRANSTAYAVNDLFLDSNGNLQAVTTAGTSGSSAPTWNTTQGGVTTDGTMQATLINKAANMLGGTKVPFTTLLFPSNAVVTSGKYLVISNPQLEVTPPSGTPTPYKENNGDDTTGTMLIDFLNTGHGNYALGNIPGQLKGSFANNPVNTNGLFSGNNPLSQSTNTKTILVAAFTMVFGDGPVSYNAGSVTPSNFGTYFVYFRDPNYAGGTVTFFATQNKSDLTAFNDIMAIGTITTATTGGGVGTGGGGHIQFQ